MERITATFDAATVSAMRRVAGKRGVSAFLQEAARQHLARIALLELLDDLDRKYGAPDAKVRREVAREAEAIFGASKEASTETPRRRSKSTSHRKKPLRDREHRPIRRPA